MKKRIISMIICVCLIAAMCTVFAACNKDNFVLSSVSYNYNGGAISQEFREAHDLQEKSIYITIINEKDSPVNYKASLLQEKKKTSVGCGGYIGATSAVVFIISIMGLVLLLRKRKKTCHVQKVRYIKLSCR